MLVHNYLFAQKAVRSPSLVGEKVVSSVGDDSRKRTLNYGILLLSINNNAHQIRRRKEVQPYLQMAH